MFCFSLMYQSLGSYFPTKNTCKKSPGAYDFLIRPFTHRVSVPPLSGVYLLTRGGSVHKDMPTQPPASQSGSRVMRVEKKVGLPEPNYIIIIYIISQSSTFFPKCGLALHTSSNGFNNDGNSLLSFHHCVENWDTACDCKVVIVTKKGVVLCSFFTVLPWQPVL